MLHGIAVCLGETWPLIGARELVMCPVPLRKHAEGRPVVHRVSCTVYRLLIQGDSSRRIH
jgi:hypothetical protein